MPPVLRTTIIGDGRRWTNAKIRRIRLARRRPSSDLLEAPLPHLHGRTYEDLPKADGDRLICEVCGRDYAGLGAHVVMAHQLTADEYRQRYGIKGFVGLCSRLEHGRRRNVALRRMAAGTLSMAALQTLAQAPGVRAKQAKTYRIRLMEDRIYNIGKVKGAPAEFFDGSGQRAQASLWKERPEWSEARRAKLRIDKGGKRNYECRICGRDFHWYQSDPRASCFDSVCIASTKKQTALANRKLAEAAFAADPQLREQRDARLRHFGQEHAARIRKPTHPCKICGAETPGMRIICGDLCLRESRRRTITAQRERYGTNLKEQVTV